MLRLAWGRPVISSEDEGEIPKGKVRRIVSSFERLRTRRRRVPRRSFHPAPHGVAEELEQYAPRILLVTTFDDEHVARRPIIKAAIRELLRNEVDVQTFAMEHFGQ